jgi:hypothetical protein
MGRPSRFSEEIAQTICERLIEGDSLREMCIKDDDLPSPGTICRWLAEDEKFREQYARAREAQCEALLEDIFEISDEEPEFHHHVGWARNRIDARKWAMSKLAPKKYGDKVLLAGADGTSPAKLEVSWLPPEPELTTGPAGNSSPSTIEPSALPASSLTDELARRSHASTTSSEPPLDVDWSDHDLPILHPTEDKPKP